VSGLPGLAGLDHAGLTVPDLDAAVAFYCDVLGATELYGLGPFDARELPATEDGRDWGDAHLRVPDARLSFRVVRLGDANVELFRYERPEDARTEPPRNSDLGGHHVAIRVRDLDAAAAHLREQDVDVMDGPIEIPEDSPGGPMRVNYFLDPFGNQLELVEYPD
jgi:catechol 2,3-dioxygenase-like lactoylglutathione lyase family enzyme